MFEHFAAVKLDEFAEKLLESNQENFNQFIKQILQETDLPFLPEAAEKPIDELLSVGAEQLYSWILAAVKAYKP